MATIGRGAYAGAVHEFFEGIRTYDVERAVAVLEDDADLDAPWADGRQTGHDAIRACLEALVTPSMERPSWTIADIDGDGHVTTMRISQSGRFGHAPVMQTWRILHLKGKIHHIVVE